MRLAIVHDYLIQYGGAERTVEAMLDVFPGAPLFTTAMDPARMPDAIRRADVRTSFLQRAPGIRRRFRAYLPLYAPAIRSLDLTDYDVVLSSSSAFAKGARIPAGAVHVCYCYNPMRFAWERSQYLGHERLSFAARLAAAPVLAWLRRWDVRNSRSVHRFLAISKAVAARIRARYGRMSEVVYPPVPTADWARLAADRTSHARLDAALAGSGFPARGFALVVSRLRAYKRVDLAIDACAAADIPLLIVGDGEARASLAARAGRRTLFLGRQDDGAVAAAYARARCLVFPGEEDFGLVPVEAHACGCPVVAFAGGGALETVTPATGVFFRAANAPSLSAALAASATRRFSARVLRANAGRFDVSVFARRLRSEVADAARSPRREDARRSGSTRAPFGV